MKFHKFLRNYSLILALICATMTVDNIFHKNYGWAIFDLVLTFLNHVTYDYHKNKIKQYRNEKIIAKILRRWADKLAPSKEIQLPALSLKVGDLLLMRAGHQYPKGTQSIDFDLVRCRTAQLLARELLKRRIILFTINDSDPYVNTIEASIYVKRPENYDNYEEI